MKSAIVVCLVIISSSSVLAQGPANERDKEKERVAAYIERGQTLFNQTCTGYCHGGNGASGGAPRLAGRGLDQEYIKRVVTQGISGTAMRPFSQVLSVGDLAAVIAYVASINGTEPVISQVVGENSRMTAASVLSPEAKRGRELFFDATLGFKRCSVCHQLDGWGIRIAEPIKNLPTNSSALRSLAPPGVFTATLNGESFPALLVQEGRGRTKTKLYDLRVIPPVLLTLPSTVALLQGSSWVHPSGSGTYSDQDLESILTFLRALAQSSGGG